MAEPPAPSRLRIDGVTKRIGRRKVLDGVSLDIRAGQVVGILGPNGAGKSTCFQVIVGLVRADSGTVSIDGRDVTHSPIDERARLGIGYLPQESSVFTRLSVKDNVRAVLEISGLRGERLDKAAGDLLDEMRIGHLHGHDPLTLSGGERRKLEIARALAIAPKFILLDEPFAAIDPISVQDLQQTIGGLKGRRIGIVITDHNVREALRICDRAHILSEGRVLASGPPESITDNPEVRDIYLGQSFD